MNEKEKINANVKYETTDANAKWLGAIGAAIVIAAIILPFLLRGLYGYLEQTATQGPAVSEVMGKKGFDAPTAPQLEPNPVDDYRKFRQSQGERLNNYGWVDEQKGVVHIPIEQAMQKLIKQGLPEIRQNANANLSNQQISNQPTSSENMTQANTTRK